MICHMKVHIVSYNLDQIFFSKSKIHILPNYEQKYLKTAILAAIVRERGVFHPSVSVYLKRLSTIFEWGKFHEIFDKTCSN